MKGLMISGVWAEDGLEQGDGPRIGRQREEKEKIE